MAARMVGPSSQRQREDTSSHRRYVVASKQEKIENNGSEENSRLLMATREVLQFPVALREFPHSFFSGLDANNLNLIVMFAYFRVR